MQLTLDPNFTEFRVLSELPRVTAYGLMIRREETLDIVEIGLATIGDVFFVVTEEVAFKLEGMRGQYPQHPIGIWVDARLRVCKLYRRHSMLYNEPGMFIPLED